MIAPEPATKMSSTESVSNGDALNVISENNKKWQNSNDRLRGLQGYVNTLVEKGIIK